jgi:uncharacterized protein
MKMRRARARPALRLACLLLVTVLAGSAAATAPAVADSIPLPPAGVPAAEDSTPVPDPVGFVNDHAGVLDPGTRARLEGFLDRLRRATGVEFAVLAVRTTAPMTPTEYKVRVFERWGLGRRGEDDGLLMLVALEEREVRFETGYGLEGTLPDGLQSRIFREIMAPRLRAGDYAGAIVEGVKACAARIADEKGVALEWEGRELRYDAPPAPRLPLALLLGLFVLVMVVVALAASRNQERFRGRRRRRRSYWDGGGWGGGWGGGMGGGWGGGGWGGGSSGGGFGGFGGGSSGGGGGGGKW